MEKISDEYLALQTELHQNPHYGMASLTYAAIVKELFVKTDAKSLSDYGAGKRNLQLGLNKLGLTEFSYFPYDPVFPEYGKPQSADLVCCIDVLEHIEPDLIDNVIAELASIVSKVGFFTIATGPAQKVLSDGRNAHLIQQPTSWWLPKFLRFFNVEQLQKDEQGFWFIVTPISATQGEKIVVPMIGAQREAIAASRSRPHYLKYIRSIFRAN